MHWTDYLVGNLGNGPSRWMRFDTHTAQNNVMAFEGMTRSFVSFDFKLINLPCSLPLTSRMSASSLRVILPTYDTSRLLEARRPRGDHHDERRLPINVQHEQLCRFHRCITSSKHKGTVYPDVSVLRYLVDAGPDFRTISWARKRWTISYAGN